MHHKKGVYAIIDVPAQDMIGVPIITPHEAVAIRTFSDVANARDSRVPHAPGEYELHRLGYLTIGANDDHAIVSALDDDHAVILTGAQWLAAQHASASTNQGN